MGNRAGGAVVNQGRDEVEQDIVRFVESDGCFVMAVFDPEHEIPDFAYSIGFPKSLSQGDVLISGLDLDMMKRLVNDTYALCRDGFQLSDFARTDELFSTFDCVVRAVAPRHLESEYFNSASWYSEQVRNESFDAAYQLVWPDKAGIFPWEEGFADGLVGAQLELWDGGATT
jgi:hypothetical protein